MAEENVKKEGETPPASGAGEVAPTMTAEEIKKLIAESVSTATAELIKTHKAEKSGLDKAITQLQKDKEALELQGKTDKEKAEILTRKEAEEKEKIEAEFRKEKADFLKLKYASSLTLPVGLTPSELTEFITGDTEEEIKPSTDKLSAFIAKIQAAGAAALIDGKNDTPGKAGGKLKVDSIESLKAQMQEAKKNGNMILAGKLLDQISELTKKN